MAFPPRSRRTRTVVDGVILPQTRPVARERKKRQARVNATSNALKNRVNFGVSNSGVSAVRFCTWSPTTASDGMKAKHFRVINELTDEGSGDHRASEMSVGFQDKAGVKTATVPMTRRRFRVPADSERRDA